jgi:four helix bundle protein
MDSQELQLRTKKFALRVIKLVGALPRTLAGKTIGGQIIRSGTSVAANYRAACRARSHAEFIAKIGTVVEESDETCFWLELIIESQLLGEKLVDPLLNEAREITAIMTATHISARKNIR